MVKDNKNTYSYVDENEKFHYIDKSGLDKACKYKTELQKARGKANWNIICKWLRAEGYDAKKCEAFRLLVKNYQQKQGNLPSKRVYKSLTARLNEYDEQLGNLALDIRDEQNTKRELNKIRRKHLDERLTDKEVNNTIKKALGNANFHITVKNGDNVVKHSKKGNAMVVGISDWHVGSRFKGVDYSFNYKILEKCVNEYLEDIKHSIDLRKPDKIYIVSLGDLIENLYMRKQDQAFESEFDLSTQETKIIELLSKFITTICSFTDAKVYYTGIAGNHDRSNGNYRNNIYGDSFNNVLGAVIKLLSKSLDNLTYIKPDDTYRTHLTINGVNIKIIHGDIDNIHDPSIIAKLSQKDNRIYQVLLLGHEHHYEVKEQNGLFFMIGSLKGADSYSDKLGLRSGRSQGFLWIDKDGSVVPEVVPLFTK